jgi:hypothetical protein
MGWLGQALPLQERVDGEAFYQGSPGSARAPGNGSSGFSYPGSVPGNLATGQEFFVNRLAKLLDLKLP